MSRKDFYIVRHGETDYNKERRWQGSGIDTNLNENGLLQAQNVAAILQGKGIEVIYSSGLKRALQTSAVLAEKFNIKVEIVKDLREGCFGDAEGMLKSEIAEKYPDVFSQWYAPQNDMNVCFPNGETKLEMQERMLKALNGLLDSDYSSIGVVSHGSSIRYLMMYFSAEIGKIPNTALFHLIYENGCWRAE